MKDDYRKILNRAEAIARRLNFGLYLVGGPLRDLLRRRKIKDLDLAVDGDSFQLAKSLAQAIKGKVTFYPQFLTAKITCPKMTIDIARTRKEIYEKPAQLPKVFPAGIEADLKRRDFTINAIAYDLINKEIFDPLAGRKDLKEGIVRVIHRRSFIDDPTRILRAIRFAQRFGFTIERETLSWMKEAIRKSFISLLSGERFLQELRLVMAEKNWQNMIEEINRLGIFRAYFGKNLPKRVERDLARIGKRSIPRNSVLLYLLSFLPTERVPLTREEKKVVSSFQRVSVLKKRLKRIKRPSTLYNQLKDFPPSALLLIKELFDQERREKIEDFLKRYQKVRTALTGKELKKLGVKPEVRYGEFLNKILARRLNGRIKNRREELEYLERLGRRYG